VVEAIRVLLVEDNDFDVGLFRRYIDQWGGSVALTVVHTVDEAEAMLPAVDPDICFVDHHLTVTNGASFIDRFKEAHRATFVTVSGDTKSRDVSVPCIDKDSPRFLTLLHAFLDSAAMKRLAVMVLTQAAV